MDSEKYLLKKDDFMLELSKIVLENIEWKGYDLIEQLNGKVVDEWGSELSFYNHNEDLLNLKNSAFFESSRILQNRNVRELAIQRKILDKYQFELNTIYSNTRQLKFYLQRSINLTLLNISSWVIDYLPNNEYKLKNYEASSSFQTLKDLVLNYKDGIGFFVNSKQREEWSELLNNELIDSVYIEYNGVKFLLYSFISKEHYGIFSKRIDVVGFGWTKLV